MAAASACSMTASGIVLLPAEAPPGWGSLDAIVHVFAVRMITVLGRHRRNSHSSFVCTQEGDRSNRVEVHDVYVRLNDPPNT